MKFEKLTLEKFRKSEFINTGLLKGGYPGETSTETHSDQIKDDSVDYTKDGEGKRNDGFSAQTYGSGLTNQNGSSSNA